MKKVFLPFCLVCLLALIFALGCSQPGDTPGDGTEKPQVALIMKSLANEFFKDMEDGAKAYQTEHAADFDLLANGIKNEEDVTGQVAMVEQMIARGVDAIVIAPADSKAMISVLERAMQAGIVVVNIDNKLDTEVLASRNLSIPFVGPDNKKSARLAGDFLAGNLQEGDAVALINGVPSAFNGIQRRLGYEEAMLAAKMIIVADQSANWDMTKANQVAAGIINEHPTLKAFLCGNDSMALGVVAALRDAGRDDVLVAGFDNITAVQQRMADGKVLCTVDQHAADLAVFGIEYALEILNTGAIPADQETPVDLITP